MLAALSGKTYSLECAPGTRHVALASDAAVATPAKTFGRAPAPQSAAPLVHIALWAWAEAPCALCARPFAAARARAGVQGRCGLLQLRRAAASAPRRVELVQQALESLTDLAATDQARPLAPAGSCAPSHGHLCLASPKEPPGRGSSQPAS